MTKEELLRLKDDITKLDREVSQDEGALKQLREELKELGFDTVVSAEKEIESLDRKIEKLESQLAKKIEEIKELMT